MIPVLGVPILNRPNLLWEMLDTVDVPVERTVIIDNGGVVSAEEEQKRNLVVIRPGYNLGVSASWNLVIKANPKSKWWMITNFDVLFAPGDLARLANYMNENEGVGFLSGFVAFGVDRSAIERAGWFDENYVPAYYEDNDFDYRCRLSGVRMHNLPAGLRHRISSTLSGDGELGRRNQMTFPENGNYYRRKWGGMPYHEVYTSPFNEGGDLRSWQLDIRRLIDQSWT